MAASAADLPGWVEGLIHRSSFEPKEPLRGGPPLEAAQLLERLARLLTHDPALFLERYGRSLTLAELSYFDPPEGGAPASYEVCWHLGSLRRTAAERETTRRNRRFRAMQELLASGDFFSDNALLERAPELYHTHIGRFCGSAIEADAVEQWRERGGGKVVSVDFDSDEESEMSDAAEDDVHEVAIGHRVAIGATGSCVAISRPDKVEGAEPVPLAEQRQLRDAFVELMKERFLAGGDCDYFDYKTVDENERFDVRRLLPRAARRRLLLVWFCSGSGVRFLFWSELLCTPCCRQDVEQQSRDAEDNWFDDESEGDD